MSADSGFAELMARVRAGDSQAAADLVRQFEAVVRMEVRVRLSDSRLRRVFDSMDVCQSVLASFFVRAAAGAYDLDSPQDLVKLLAGMVRNKVAFQARKQRARRRDYRRVEAVPVDALEQAGSDVTPSQHVADAELLREFRRRLSAEEQQLAERRALGQPWADIAHELGGTPQGRRKQLERAVARVAQELGIEEPDDA